MRPLDIFLSMSGDYRPFACVDSNDDYFQPTEACWSSAKPAPAVNDQHLVRGAQSECASTGSSPAVIEPRRIAQTITALHAPRKRKEGRQRRGFSGQDDKKITTGALTDQFGRIYPTEGLAGGRLSAGPVQMKMPAWCGNTGGQSNPVWADLINRTCA
jgi:hypothetical protein